MYYPKLTTQPVPDYIIENTIDDKIEARENIENQTPISTNSDGETVNPEGEPANTEEIKKFTLLTSSTGRVMQPRKFYKRNIKQYMLNQEIIITFFKTKKMRKMKKTTTQVH